MKFCACNVIVPQPNQTKPNRQMYSISNIRLLFIVVAMKKKEMELDLVNGYMVWNERGTAWGDRKMLLHFERKLAHNSDINAANHYAGLFFSHVHLIRREKRIN